MKIRIDTTKSIEDNATFYYDKSKKARRKLEGLKIAIENTKKKIENMESQPKRVQIQYKDPPEKKWYMKFRWFTSSDGFLCIGGRDAMTNEIIIKKHTDPGDLVFHTENPGSPFFVIKAEGKEIPNATKKETAIATAAFSRAWREGLGTTEVYAISPDQVKKDEGLAKGSFMIHGKREYFRPIIKLYLGIVNDYLECTPVVSEFSIKHGGKISDCAKKIRHKIMEKYQVKYELDDIIRILPGDCSLEIVKE